MVLGGPPLRGSFYCKKIDNFVLRNTMESFTIIELQRMKGSG
jgi:hypothetical protein